MEGKFWLIIAGVIVGMVGLFALTQQDSGSGTNTGSKNAIFDEGKELLEIQSIDQTFGEGASGVTLIEYGDLECPACAAVFGFIKQAELEFEQDITIAYRHFPLPIHKNANAAHRAAYAAGKQDKFWEMHDLLYQRQEQWNGPSSIDPVGIDIGAAIQLFETYATELELDVEQFKNDRDSEEAAKTIDAFVDSGNELDVTGTPTLFVNGTQIDTPRSYEELRAAIQTAIDEAQTNDSQSQEELSSRPTDDTSATTEPTTE